MSACDLSRRNPAAHAGTGVMSASMTEGEFLTDDDLCNLVRKDKRTTQRWRNSGEGPPYIRVGKRHILYRRADVEAWLADRTYPHRASEAVKS